MKKPFSSFSRCLALLVGISLPLPLAHADGVKPSSQPGTDQKTNTSTAAQPGAELPATPAIPASLPSSTENDNGALLLHSRRVTATQELAKALDDTCPAPVISDDTKLLLEKGLSRILAQKKGLPELEARRRKLEQDAAAAPRDGRIINALIRLAAEKKALEESARVEAQGKGAELARQINALSGSLCTELCSGSDTTEHPINLCAFSSPVLANAAAISDFSSVESIAGNMRERITSLPLVLGDNKKTSFTLGELAAAEPLLSSSLGLLRLKDAAMRVTPGEHTGLDLVGFTAGVADVAVRALANVIVDRAKREVLVYFLEQLHADVCGPETLDGLNGNEHANAFREIRTYWLPHTCNLAQKPLDFLQYGGGATLLLAIRGAIAEDVRGWPGAMVGLGLGASLTLDPLNKAAFQGSVFACPADKTPNECKLLQTLRERSAALILSLARGPNAALSFYHFGKDLHATFRANADTKKLYTPSLQVAACAASIPLLFQEYGPLVAAMRPGRAGATEALLLAALTSSPACFSLVGKGFSSAECPGFSSSSSGPLCLPKVESPLKVAADATTALEKLSTLARFSSRIQAEASLVSTQWDAVLSAFTAYENAALAYQEKGLGREPVLATSQVLARASLDLAMAFVKGSVSIQDTALLPGLCTEKECSAAYLSTLFADAELDLGRILSGLDLLSALLAQDEGQLIARVMTALRVESRRLCPNGAASCGPVDRLSRHIGLFAALAFEQDPNKVAAALDAAAMPVGGFRRKNVPGSFTVTAGAFPGLALAGAELRLGPYGGQKETMKTPYLVAPTLTLPVGLDFAQGYGNYNVGLFVSALDPAAYLQYDASQDGRLPGAKVLTALAPGLWFRVGLFGSPFTVSAYSVFRPGLRAWESGTTSPAAHALQFGLAASVDVSLFDLFTGSAQAP